LRCAGVQKPDEKGTTNFQLEPRSQSRFFVSDNSNSIGLFCSTYTGTVTAANDWGSPAQHMQVKPGMPGSFELLFHKVSENSKRLHTEKNPKAQNMNPRTI
jgi:erythromycin esterase-like protein